MNVTTSIIIPVYNVEEYLPKCLDSILVDNNYKEEMICVNDGSTDGSLSVLEKYAVQYPNIKIITQPNKGLSEARNTGLRAAQGDYVFFIDSDDWLFPNSLQNVIEKIEEEDVLYYNAKKVYEDTGAIDVNYDIQERKHMSGQAYFAAIQNESRNMPCVCVCGGLYRRRFLLDNQLWNEPGIYHEDSYFTPQVLLNAHDVSCVNEYVYAYRIRTSGSITASTRPKHIQDSLFICRNLYAIYDQYDRIEDVFYSYVADSYINLICRAYEHHLLLWRWWKIKDSKIFAHSARNARQRKAARLSYISPKISYDYLTDNLPSLLRRFVNRYL